MTNTAICAILIDFLIDEQEREEKKKRLWCKQWLLKRKKCSHVTLLKELEDTCPPDYKNFLRMDNSAYKYLLEIVTPLIEKQDTILRESISANERLSATLRFLATGCSFEDLKFKSRIAAPTLGIIIIETCKAIIKVLRSYISLPKSEAEWKAVAKDYEEMWNFPNCIGSIDGKYIDIKKPAHSGAYYFNYKKTFSIVLMAIVNAKYEFLMVDVGANGRVSDGGVFKSTKLHIMLEEQSLNIPQPRLLNGFNKTLPYVFVTDDAFQLTENMMKPYGANNLSQEQQAFNYRLSRARRMVENVFGILGSRFRILLTTINLSPEKTIYIVLACCYLHNFLRKRNSTTHLQGNISQNSNTPLTNLESTKNRNSSNAAKEIRNTFCEYFNTVGSVPFQP